MLFDSRIIFMLKKFNDNNEYIGYQKIPISLLQQIRWLASCRTGISLIMRVVRVVLVGCV